MRAYHHVLDDDDGEPGWSKETSNGGVGCVVLVGGKLDRLDVLLLNLMGLRA